MCSHNLPLFYGYGFHIIAYRKTYRFHGCNLFMLCSFDALNILASNVIPKTKPKLHPVCDSLNNNRKGFLLQWHLYHGVNVSQANGNSRFQEAYTGDKNSALLTIAFSGKDENQKPPTVDTVDKRRSILVFFDCQPIFEYIRGTRNFKSYRHVLSNLSPVSTVYRAKKHFLDNGGQAKKTGGQRVLEK